MSRALLCPCCRQKAERAASAALSVLADPGTGDEERQVATEEAARALDLLSVPPGMVTGP
jgi:hypothetical protein